MASHTWHSYLAKKEGSETPPPPNTHSPSTHDPLKYTLFTGIHSTENTLYSWRNVLTKFLYVGVAQYSWVNASKTKIAEHGEKTAYGSWLYSRLMDVSQVVYMFWSLLLKLHLTGHFLRAQ